MKFDQWDIGIMILFLPVGIWCNYTFYFVGTLAANTLSFGVALALLAIYLARHGPSKR